MMVIASVITVSDNGLAFTAIAEIAGPFWSGRALGTQNTSQLLTAGVAPPLFGAIDRDRGLPRGIRRVRTVSVDRPPPGARRRGSTDRESQLSTGRRCTVNAAKQAAGMSELRRK